ncbi:hypothetical protein DL93DRAFT_2077935 [Clavulina sp. PMI_390]|nr:hypothetical protein DL93DRAFT_2077935 [Clavulina sp. PMI_390]
MIPPHSLIAIPCLRFLRIGHFGLGIVRYLVTEYKLDSNFSQNNPRPLLGSPLLATSQALRDFLDLGQCPASLLRVWVDIGGYDIGMTVALRIRAERETLKSYCS